MFQGTGSGVGKSVVAAALCRCLKNMGYRVAPFKAQNMALNSYVTADGREMGRAQVFQAEACGLPPDCRMNPVLLKPTADAKSQVILMGRPVADLRARDYYRRARHHFHIVKEAYDSLSAEFDIMVIEGAGSPAEINLQETDIVNMRMAHYANASVFIVGDIDRGGVFAALKGTYDLIPDRYKFLVKGHVINRFRGDISLLLPAFEMFRKFNPVPIAGVLPWFHDIPTDEEDGVFLDKIETEGGPDKINVAVVGLKRISNFTDFLPLSMERDLAIKIARSPGQIETADMVIIPGTKATTMDLKFLEDTGMDRAINQAAHAGKMVIGICGGYQMLGSEIDDPHGSDGPPGRYRGLGLLPLITCMESQKTLVLTEREIHWPTVLGNSPLTVSGYEIHMGATSPLEHWGTGCNPLDTDTDDSPDRRNPIGFFSRDGMIMGTYLHGIFENHEFRTKLLNFLRSQKGLPPVTQRMNYRREKEKNLDRLGDWFARSMNLKNFLKMAGILS